MVEDGRIGAVTTPNKRQFDAVRELWHTGNGYFSLNRHQLKLCAVSLLFVGTSLANLAIEPGCVPVPDVLVVQSVCKETLVRIGS